MSRRQEQKKTVIKTTHEITTTRIERSAICQASTFTQHGSGSNLSQFHLTGAPISRLDNSLLSVGTRPRLGSIQTDATPIYNPNYQSPYRNSELNRSYRLPSTTTSYHPPMPATSTPHLPPKELGDLKKFKVKKTGKFHDQDPTIKVPTYSTHSKKRGEVLIINNIMFKEKGYRSGAKMDHKNLRSLFQQMGFNVSLEKDLKSGEMVSKVKSFSQKGGLKDSDMAIVVIMSHGTINETVGKTEVFGLDEHGVAVDQFLEYFRDDKCKHMINKPKIFIFQCCRGDNEQFLQSDAQRVPQSKAAVTDTLVAYSTLPGFVSHRNPQSGTWYVSALCEVFSEHAHEYNIEDLLKMVDVRLGSISTTIKQSTQYDNRGFKRCFLHPV